MLISPAFVLSIALSSGLGPRLVLGIAPGEVHETRDDIVWRADDRSPDEVRQQRGFWPRGLNGGNYPIHVVDVPQGTPDISLFRHVAGVLGQAVGRDASGYVSTTRDFARSMDWLYRNDRIPGYLYEIRPTPNFIDVNETLGAYYQYPSEQEVAALGGIHFSQILGWHHVIPNPTNGQLTLLGPYIRNVHYNPIFNTARRARSPQYQLAGFPDGHDAYREPPWNAFANCGGAQGPNKRNVQESCPAKLDPTEYISTILAIKRVTVVAKLSGDSNSQTTDSVAFQIGRGIPVHLFSGGSPGETFNVTTSVHEMFNYPQVSLSDLTSMILVQSPAGHVFFSDDFKIESMALPSRCHCHSEKC